MTRLLSTGLNWSMGASSDRSFSDGTVSARTCVVVHFTPTRDDKAEGYAKQPE
ncbi:hypothetical protein GCM10022198_04490 [Klugiella xanthotipulae]